MTSIGSLVLLSTLVAGPTQAANPLLPGRPAASSPVPGPPSSALAARFVGSGTVTVTVAAQNPVLGVDQETDVLISWEGPPAPPLPPPVLATTVGTIEDLVRTGPHSFTARLVYPSQRFPQIALLGAAFADPPAQGMAVVFLRAAASPTFVTDPGAIVTLTVGEKTFGPQRASSDGSVRVPVVVPPGIDHGTARSTNQTGQTTEQIVDLQPPSFPRVLLLTPQALPVGGSGLVTAFAIEPDGHPLAPELLAVQAADTTPQRLSSGADGLRLLVRAPGGKAGGSMVVSAEIRGDRKTHVARSIHLTAAAPTRVLLRPELARLPIGSRIHMFVYVTAEDSYGNRWEPHDLSVSIDGQRQPLVVTEDGRKAVALAAPDEDPGRPGILVEAGAGAAFASLWVPYGNRRPAPPVPHPRQDPWLTVLPRAGGMWRPSQPGGPAGHIDVLAQAHRAPWPPGLLLGLSSGYLFRPLRADNAAGVSTGGMNVWPIYLRGCWQTIFPRGWGLGITAALGIALAWEDLATAGYHERGSRLAPGGDGGLEWTAQIGTGQGVLGLRYEWVVAHRFSSGDRFTGNAAGLLADVGYRFGW